MYDYNYDELEQLRIENKILKKFLKNLGYNLILPKPRQIDIDLMSMNEITGLSIKKFISRKRK